MYEKVVGNQAQRCSCVSRHHKSKSQKLLYIIQEINRRSRRDTMLAITNATIIDGNGNEPYNNGTVLIDGERISAIGPQDAVHIPRDTTGIVDAQGASVLLSGKETEENSHDIIFLKSVGAFTQSGELSSVVIQCRVSLSVLSVAKSVGI
jgi:hypothetical protein